MIIDNKKLAEARLFISRLAEGKNPTTNETIEDPTLNNSDVIRVMYYVNSLLDKIEAGELRSKKKDPFPYEILSQYKFTGDTGITNLIRQICEPIKGENVQMPSPQMAGGWLRSEGYLTDEYVPEVESENVIPTEKGKAIGIYTKTREFQGRKFLQLYYSRPAQEFVVDNFDKILNYRKSAI